MIARKRIYDMHRGEYKGELFSHCRDSANILSRVSRELDKHPAPYRLDYKWPFHLIVYMNGWQLSVFAGGFDKSIDIMPLKRDGSPYRLKYERRFLTPRGAVNYILRKYGRPGMVE